MDDERPVDELERLADVVIRNKHPDSPRGELAHQLADITDRNRIDAGEWLVEEHELRFGGESARDFSPPAFAARQRHSRRAPEMGNLKTHRATHATFSSRAARLLSCSSRTARMLSSTVSPRKIDASWGR